MKSTHRAPRATITPHAPAGLIWFPANEDTTCPECHAPVLGGMHQCTPKAV